MFGNHFAFGFQGSGEEGWVPPWQGRWGHDPHFLVHQHGPFGQRGRARGNDWAPPWLDEDGPGPHFFAMRRGRGPFGRGGPFGFGPGGPFGPGGEGGRFFGRGDMKFALLELLQERPMHGYEMMKALAEKSGGFYTPSPGSIYPTLQMLEEGGYVNGNEVEGKKVYSITDAGRTMLTEHHDEEGFAGPPWMRWHGRGGHGERGGVGMRLEMQALRSEAAEVARLFAIAGRASIQNPEQLAQLRGIIERTRKDLTTLIYGEQSTQQSQGSATTSPSEGTPTVDQT